MRFYVVTYSSEGEPEGIGYEFFTSKREALRCKASMEKVNKEREPCNNGCGTELLPRQQCPTCGSYDNRSIEEAEIRELEFKGTCKQMVFEALQYQVV